jgi:spermidine/putrescine ABC transporter ATP-binding subunit
MSRVRFESVVKEYGAVTALQPLDLEVREGEFLTLLGPSGCGKTTTLRLIAGLILPTRGRLYLGDEEVSRLPPEKRNVGMVFQDYALFPHMTVMDNIAFPLVERGGHDRAAIRRRVAELLELVSLPGVEARYPAQLSGGQQQRIAVARAVAFAPKVLLLDEPLGALDLKLRESMQVELRRIQQELRITTVSVTHDQTEAMNMSDRIAIMNHGVLEQIGSATEIYDWPRTKYVADFVGQINFLPARVTGRDGEWATVEALGRTFRARGDSQVAAGRDVAFAIRPERLWIARDGAAPAGTDGLPGTIASVRFVGNRSLVGADVGTGSEMVVEVPRNEPCGRLGDRVTVCWTAGDAIVLAE